MSNERASKAGGRRSKVAFFGGALSATRLNCGGFANGLPEAKCCERLINLSSFNVIKPFSAEAPRSKVYVSDALYRRRAQSWYMTEIVIFLYVDTVLNSTQAP